VGGVVPVTDELTGNDQNGPGSGRIAAAVEFRISFEDNRDGTGLEIAQQIPFEYKP
jgi:hypothetical protein